MVFGSPCAYPCTVTGTNICPCAEGLDIGTGRIPVGVYTCWPAGAPGIIATPVVEEGRGRWEGGRCGWREGGI